MHNLFVTAWYQNKFWVKLFYPLHLLVLAVSSLKRYCYQIGLLKSTKLSVPVIIVGNLTVGGTGKTPTVIALCDFFKQQGFRPGVISRGYAATSKIFPHEVKLNEAASFAGDEPYLIHSRTACPVVIDPNRVRAGQYLLQHHDCNIIISDDGLQHYALARDVEILMLHAEKKLGNELCLPAGPLRESKQRVNTVDFVLQNGGEQQDYYVIQHQFSVLKKLNDTEELPVEFLAGKNVDAVAGIAHPDQFFSALEKLQADVTQHAYPDHHHYSQADFLDKKAMIVMTEKDAVKCQALDLDNAWYLPLQSSIEQGLLDNLLHKVRRS